MDVEGIGSGNIRQHAIEFIATAPTDRTRPRKGHSSFPTPSIRVSAKHSTCELAGRTDLRATVRVSGGGGPFEESNNDFIYWVTMGNRAHMPKFLKLHYLNSRQCIRQKPCYPLSRGGRAFAHHIEHRNVEGTERQQRCGLSAQSVRPSTHVPHRGGDRSLALTGNLFLVARTHPVDNEPLGGD